MRISKRATVLLSRNRNLIRVRQVDNAHYSKTRAPSALARMRANCYVDIVTKARGKVHQALDGKDLNASVSQSRDPRGVDAEPYRKQARRHSRRHVEHRRGQFEPYLFLVDHDANLGRVARIPVITAMRAPHFNASTVGRAFNCEHWVNTDNN